MDTPKALKVKGLEMGQILAAICMPTIITY
jgi:hypothetical protein